jgi:peroxiredoxin-like protein
VSIVRTFRFPASVQWRGGRLTRASAHGKPELEVATPPEFKGGVGGVWSPEELLVTSLASCFTVTLAAVAERIGIDLETVNVDGVGYVERGEDGRFRFDVIKLAVEIGADADPRSLERLVAQTERLCIVSLALDVPVQVRLADAPARATATAAWA